MNKQLFFFHKVSVFTTEQLTEVLEQKQFRLAGETWVCHGSKQDCRDRSRTSINDVQRPQETARNGAFPPQKYVRVGGVNVGVKDLSDVGEPLIIIGRKFEGEGRHY